MPEFDNNLGAKFIAAAPAERREELAARHARRREREIWQVPQHHLVFGANRKSPSKTRRCVILRLNLSKTRYVVRPCTGQFRPPPFIELPNDKPLEVKWLPRFHGPSWAARNVTGDVDTISRDSIDYDSERFAPVKVGCIVSPSLFRQLS